MTSCTAPPAAQRREFREWTPEGPDAYNPFAHGTDTELADKALAGETYTEPHYLRQAQRYLGHATRTLRAAGQPVTLATLTEAMSPRRLEAIGRRLDDEHQAQELHDYLDDLSPEQQRGLAGTRDRLAILAESDVAPWLQPHDAGGTEHRPAASHPGAARSSTSAWTPTADRCSRR